jgi:hypothetical protein
MLFKTIPVEVLWAWTVPDVDIQELSQPSSGVTWSLPDADGSVHQQQLPSMERGNANHKPLRATRSRGPAARRVHGRYHGEPRKLAVFQQYWWLPGPRLTVGMCPGVQSLADLLGTIIRREAQRRKLSAAHKQTSAALPPLSSSACRFLFLSSSTPFSLSLFNHLFHPF